MQKQNYFQFKPPQQRASVIAQCAIYRKSQEINWLESPRSVRGQEIMEGI